MSDMKKETYIKNARKGENDSDLKILVSNFSLHHNKSLLVAFVEGNTTMSSIRYFEQCCIMKK